MKSLAVPAMILVALAALAIWDARQQVPQPAAQPIVCADPVAGCAFLLNGLPAQLRFSVQPQALRPFVLSVAGSRSQRRRNE